jgi:hypothetical protein
MNNKFIITRFRKKSRRIDKWIIGCMCMSRMVKSEQRRKNQEGRQSGESEKQIGMNAVGVD